MKIGIPKESHDGETRVALVPSMVGLITKQNYEVCVAAGAGEGSSFADEAYEKAGAKCVKDNKTIFGESDITIKVQPLSKDEAGQLKDGSIYIGYMAPLYQKEVIEILNRKKITAFAMEFIPRITRAQSMDSLSSMATVSGDKAVLIAAAHLGKFLPPLRTAAGTVPPVNVFILCSCSAGLQAIPTANHCGAK